MSKLIQNMK